MWRLNPSAIFRIAIMFLLATLAQVLFSLLVIRSGFWSCFFGIPGFLIYLVVFGAAFVILTRRAFARIRNTWFRFSVPIFFSLTFVIASALVGSYLGRCLNDRFFHMPYEDFDR